MFARLSCCECQALLGHRYSHVPADLAAVASTPGAPRYAMQRHSLASYVFGSAKTQHDSILGCLAVAADAPNRATEPASADAGSVGQPGSPLGEGRGAPNEDQDSSFHTESRFERTT